MQGREILGYRGVKRFLDIVFSAAFLALTAPAQALLAVLVRVFLGRPIYFIQDRPGLNGEVFSLVKFRTMKNISHTEGDISDEARVTKFGVILRSTSLDELPTLLNVLKGEMSMIGPRPLLVEYLEHYSPHQARRHDVRPGVTGLAQVSGRNLLDWNRKFELDVHYVDNLSFRLDLVIAFRTVATVLCRHGVSAPGRVTAAPFTRTSAPKSQDRERGIS